MVAVKTGSVALIIAGALYIVGFVQDDLSVARLSLLAFGVVQILLALWLLKTGSRGLVWVAYFVAIIAAIVALLHIESPVMSNLVCQTIAVFDGVAALSFFLVLWRQRRRTAAP